MQLSASLPHLYLKNNARGVLLVNLSGFVTEYDNTAEKLLNVPRQKVLHHPIWESFPDEYFGFSIKNVLADKQIPTSLNAPSPTLNFTEVEALFISPEPPLSFTTPSAEGLLILLRSLNELERWKVIAARNDHLKELDKMAALVAHEIRNPLGGIMGFASLLDRELQNQPDLQKLAKHVLEGTQSLSRLINRILSHTLPSPLDLKPCHLAPFLNELVLHLQMDKSIDSRITFNLEKASETITSLVDTDHLQSALLNLTSNAIQAMPKGGTIRIKLSETENEAVIEITDSGVGIAEENKSKIFSPFFTTRLEGHGFGLMEVHKIVQEHHGEIEFFSTPEVGTTFIIYLPKIPSPKNVIPASF